jgi:hypothetical protein
MKSSINNASAHQHSGGPSTFPYRDGDRNNRRRSADIADVECEIAELINRSTARGLLRHGNRSATGRARCQKRAGMRANLA